MSYYVSSKNNGLVRSEVKEDTMTTSTCRF